MRFSGGAVLFPRQLTESVLWEAKPPWWFKVYFFIVANANFKDHNKINKRGSLYITYERIHRGCYFGNDIKVNSIDNVIRFLKSTGQITTQKTTRGFIITVLNYDQLQSFSTYKNDTENEESNDRQTNEERYDNGTNETKGPNNNYLKKSNTCKETNSGENSQPSTRNQPKSNSQSEVVFRSLLKKTKLSIDSWLDKYPDSELDNGTISRNTDAAIKGILYYIRRYKIFCGIDHPNYKLPQLRDCMEGFLDGIWQIERCGIKIPLEEIVVKVIDRWFNTTSSEPNNLRLSHFVGNISLVFSNSLESVMADYGLCWKEDTDANS